MKKLVSCILITLMMVSMMPLAIPSSASASTTKLNNYPIVLVHGLFGFDDLAGIPYWGFAYNIPKDLESRGYNTIVVSVGPFSSVWDRSCELYAQLVGGTVDYGKIHSERYGHARYGRTYPGMYTQFGKIDPVTGNRSKIHLLGHSMGGPTIRAFAAMLEQGSAEERAGTPADELSPFFAGDKQGWIGGVLALSAPGDGTPVMYSVCGKGKQPYLIQQMVLAFAELCGGTVFQELFDPRMDQWGFKREKGESLEHFMERLVESDVYKNSHDLAFWDLKPEGAMELNKWATAQPDIYYFSQGSYATQKSALGYHVPTAAMNPALWGFATYIGSYTQTEPFVIDKSWWQNDGALPAATADGPRINSPDQIVQYTGTPQIGKWNYLGKIKGLDHLAIIGGGIYDPRPLFRQYAKMLTSLPE